MYLFVFLIGFQFLQGNCDWNYFDSITSQRKIRLKISQNKYYLHCVFTRAQMRKNIRASECTNVGTSVEYFNINFLQLNTITERNVWNYTVYVKIICRIEITIFRVEIRYVYSEKFGASSEFEKSAIQKNVVSSTLAH